MTASCHPGADALALLQRLVAEVEALRARNTAGTTEDALRLVVREELARHHQTLAADRLTAPERRVMAALPALFEVGDLFTTAGLVDLAEQRLAARVELREALRAAGATTAQRVGLLLRRLADAGAVVDGVRVVAVKCEAGSRQWSLQGGQGM